MYAVIEVGGTQFKVREKETLQVPRISQDEGKKIHIDTVLLLVDGKDVTVGKPHIKGAKITATVVGHGKDKKVKVFKKKRRKGYKVLKGHRQQYTELRIDSIGTGTKKSASHAAPEASEKKAAPPAAKPAAAKKSQGGGAKSSGTGKTASASASSSGAKKTAAKKSGTAKSAPKKTAAKKTAPKKSTPKKSGSSAGGSKKSAASGAQKKKKEE